VIIEQCRTDHNPFNLQPHSSLSSRLPAPDTITAAWLVHSEPLEHLSPSGDQEDWTARLRNGTKSGSRPLPGGPEKETIRVFGANFDISSAEAVIRIWMAQEN
jgi:hypothetical protein